MVTILLALLAQSTVDSSLDAMVAARDAASYVAARDRLTALGQDALATLTTRSAADKWTREGWIRALAAEACRLRIAEPELAAAVERPGGLDPRRYHEFRRPEPMIAPELSRLGVAAVPLLLERWRWTFEAYPFSGGEAGQLERTVLRHAILEVPGLVGDARARHFLQEIVRGEHTESWRQQAAVSLGMCAGTEALAVLIQTLDDRKQPASVREACARALGRVPDDAALEALRSRLGAANEDPTVRRSLIAGLGFLGTAWAWNARGNQLAPKADRIRRGCAEALVEAVRRYPEYSDAISIALSLTAWPESVADVETLASDLNTDAAVRDTARSVLEPLKRAVARRK